jgi:hypothetical protein
MKANEIRLGNYYNQFGNIHQVNGHIISELEKAPQGQLWCKPIPLTEEWLLKFGFEDKQTCFNLSKREKLGHDFGDFAVSKYDDTQMKVWRGDRYIGVCHIQYVHQLQNLCFALTNEELTMK